MKKFVLLLLMLPIVVVAQEVKTQIKDTSLLQVLEKSPLYPGGEVAVYADLAKRVKYPKEAVKRESQGVVVVQFVVEKDGSVSNINVIRDDVGHGAAESVVKAVKKLKKWTPGEIDGRKVRCKFQLPVTFKL